MPCPAGVHSGKYNRVKYAAFTGISLSQLTNGPQRKGTGFKLLDVYLGSEEWATKLRVRVRIASDWTPGVEAEVADLLVVRGVIINNLAAFSPWHYLAAFNPPQRRPVIYPGETGGLFPFGHDITASGAGVPHQPVQQRG